MKNEINMKQYGLSESFAHSAEDFMGLTVSRIISQQKGIYRLVSERGEKSGEVCGKFHYEVKKLSEYPAVGDFVMVDWNEGGGNAVIRHILDRRSCFIRKAAGAARQEQVIAANIDTVFLCMSLNRDFNLRRMERYLSIAWESGAVPVIVLTKSDLCTDTAGRLSEVSCVAAGADIIVTGAVEQNGCEQLYKYITNGKTVAFIGSSGVGKSTLINCLLGEERLCTGGLRNDDKGRHTTTHRELILLPGGGMVIDTPGMRELGMWDSGEGIDRTFSDIEALALKCRFRDCSHSGEPGCAVQQSIENGELSADRLSSYRKLKNEDMYSQDAEDYLARKKQKFKSIAKINKNNHKQQKGRT